MSTDVSTVTRCDALSTYLRNAAEYGSGNVFLLESLAGPATDTRETVVGLFGPLWIKIHQGIITVDAPEALRLRIEATLQQRSVMDVNHVLTNRTEVWRIPALIIDDLQCDSTPADFNAFFVNFGYDAVFYAEDLEARIPSPPTHAPPDIEYRLVISTLTIPAHGGMASEASISGPNWDRRAVIPATNTEPVRRDVAPMPPPDSAVRDEMTRDEFVAKVHTCQEYIRGGEIYQVQLGHQIDITSSYSPIDVYRRLTERNPSPYMALVPVTGGLMIVASPELFVRKAGARAAMRPIAGTARKADLAGRDEAQATLLSDDKECAEHLMLVDLCRNDLGRVGAYGSLDVTELMVIEEYSHLYHMVSEVQVDVRSPFDAYDVIEATFPAGTMTGAPKIRAMEIIEQLEKSRRGYYAGAFGLTAFSGDCVLGLSIRMAIHRENTYSIRASAGIVADSAPTNEWRETLTKMGATFWAITGKELLDDVS